MNVSSRICLCVAVSFLSACSTIHYPFSLEDTPAKSLSLDAKQRAILVKDNAGPKKDQRIVCAEPAPDAMAGLTTSGALKAQLEGQGGEVSARTAEALARLGDRTQTIGILRDGLYRACEAYMNGAINQEEYAYIVSGYDDFVVTVVGLDGLTQIVRENQPAGSGPPKTAPEAVAAAVERIIKSYLEHQVIMEKLYLQEKKH